MITGPACKNANHCATVTAGHNNTQAKRHEKPMAQLQQTSSENVESMLLACGNIWMLVMDHFTITKSKILAFELKYYRTVPRIP